MAKTKISEYSSTASNNTDVAGINIAEGMAPSNVNNAMRAIMAQLKDFQSGAVSQDLSVNGAMTCTGNAILSSDLSVAGKATIGGAMTCTGTAVMSSNLSVAGNATISGTLSSTGATSLGAVTCSGAAVMSSTLAVSDNTNLKKSVTLGTSTSDTVTMNALLSAGGGTGTSGQVLKTNGTASSPSWSSLSGLSDFDKSLDANGYQKLPGGLILQWGFVGNGTAGNAGSSATVTFPIAFPSAVVNVQLAVVENDNSGATCARSNAISTTGFTWRTFAGASASSADRVYWLAIGY